MATDKKESTIKIRNLVFYNPQNDDLHYSSSATERKAKNFLISQNTKKSPNQGPSSLTQREITTEDSPRRLNFDSTIAFRDPTEVSMGTRTTTFFDDILPKSLKQPKKPLDFTKSTLSQESEKPSSNELIEGMMNKSRTELSRTYKLAHEFKNLNLRDKPRTRNSRENQRMKIALDKLTEDKHGITSNSIVTIRNDISHLFQKKSSRSPTQKTSLPELKEQLNQRFSKLINDINDEEKLGPTKSARFSVNKSSNLLDTNIKSKSFFNHEASPSGKHNIFMNLHRDIRSVSSSATQAKKADMPNTSGMLSRMNTDRSKILFRGPITDFELSEDDSLVKSLKTELPNAFSSNPSNRQEVLTLGNWLISTIKGIQEDEETSLRDKYYKTDEVYNLCFNELVRQVSFDCLERSELIMKIWKAYFSLSHEIIEDVKAKEKRIKEKAAAEQEELKVKLDQILKKKDKEVDDMKKEVEEKVEKIMEQQTRINRFDEDHVQMVRESQAAKEAFTKLQKLTSSMKTEYRDLNYRYEKLKARFEEDDRRTPVESLADLKLVSKTNIDSLASDENGNMVQVFGNVTRKVIRKEDVAISMTSMLEQQAEERASRLKEEGVQTNLSVMNRRFDEVLRNSETLMNLIREESAKARLVRQTELMENMKNVWRNKNGLFLNSPTSTHGDEDVWTGKGQFGLNVVKTPTQKQGVSLVISPSNSEFIFKRMNNNGEEEEMGVSIVAEGEERQQEEGGMDDQQSLEIEAEISNIAEFENQPEETKQKIIGAIMEKRMKRISKIKNQKRNSHLAADENLSYDDEIDPLQLSQIEAMAQKKERVRLSKMKSAQDAMKDLSVLMQSPQLPGEETFVEKKSSKTRGRGQSSKILPLESMKKLELSPEDLKAQNYEEDIPSSDRKRVPQQLSNKSTPVKNKNQKRNSAFVTSTQNSPGTGKSPNMPNVSKFHKEKKQDTIKIPFPKQASPMRNTNLTLSSSTVSRNDAMLGFGVEESPQLGAEYPNNQSFDEAKEPQSIKQAAITLRKVKMFIEDSKEEGKQPMLDEIVETLELVEQEEDNIEAWMDNQEDKVVKLLNMYKIEKKKQEELLALNQELEKQMTEDGALLETFQELINEINKRKDLNEEQKETVDGLVKSVQSRKKNLKAIEELKPKIENKRNQHHGEGYNQRVGGDQSPRSPKRGGFEGFGDVTFRLPSYLSQNKGDFNPSVPLTLAQKYFLIERVSNSGHNAISRILKDIQSGKISQKYSLPLKLVLKQMTLFYQEKIHQWRDNPMLKEQDFGTFIYKQFLNTYGFHKFGLQKFAKFIVSIKQHISVHRVHNFARIMNLLDGDKNFNLQETKQYFKGMEYFFYNATPGAYFVNSDYNKNHFVPYLKAMEYLKIFMDKFGEKNQEGNMEFRKEIEELKIVDPNKVNAQAIIDIDLFLEKLVLRYRLLISKAKPHMQTIFLAADSLNEGAVRFSGFWQLFKTIEGDRWDEKKLEDLFINYCDVMSEDHISQSKEQFSSFCFDLDLLTENKINGYFKISKEEEWEAKIGEFVEGWEDKGDVVSNWIEKKQSYLAGEIILKWRRILQGIDSEIDHLEEIAEKKGLWIRSQVLQYEIEHTNAQ